ncbi:hypothetical protein OIU83_13205 [Flavobacterium sp. LS1R49]|uniref:Uncharacterized protein n=1 Tax=Flavobacterium shii TaxID=2987687 RepID=A0A9X2ZFU4_9FLAO|nr:hypothetical protein [Flavobacterium shii]MCV9928620.1 hypothetical protein [Flavobacterium shii]
MKPTFDKEDLDTIEKILGIPFITDYYVKGEVCFANDDEIRGEFRESFDRFHVLSYINAIIDQSINEESNKPSKTNFIKIPYPKDSAYFWKLVAIGEKLEKNYLIENTKTKNQIEIKWYNLKK